MWLVTVYANGRTDTYLTHVAIFNSKERAEEALATFLKDKQYEPYGGYFGYVQPDELSLGEWVQV
jgi:hypothetical protein